MNDYPSREAKAASASPLLFRPAPARARALLLAILLPLALVLLGLNERKEAQALPPLPHAPPPAVARKIEPALLKQLLTQKEGLTPFIAHFAERADLPSTERAERIAQRAAVVNALQATANRAQDGARRLLAAREQEGRVARVRPFWVVNAVAGHADRETIFEIAARPEVALVRADHTRKWIDYQPIAQARPEAPTLDLRALLPETESPKSAYPATASIEWNIRQIAADTVWTAFNFDGSGVVVANLDTGVDWQHPALLSKYRGYHGNGPAVHLGNWFDATGAGYLYPGDNHGHGTHTMGTLVGGSADRIIGVAPGAKWIAAKVFNNFGFADDSWIHAGFQWMIAPEGDPALAPDVVSNSWGSNFGSDTTFLEDVRALRAVGILPVFSNGNNGTSGAGTVGSPASFDESLAVGATDAGDAVAYFSSRGPSPLTGHVKPDVSAPGVNIVSSMPGGGYRAANGTSMASPHVAGVAALLKQARPELTITDTIYIITSTAKPLSSTVPNNDTGWGRVDAYDAVLRATAYGTLSGTITSNGVPIAQAQIIATDRVSRTAQTVSDAGGRYQLPLLPDLYWVSFFAFGYAPSLNHAIWITSSQVTTFNVELSALPTATVGGRVLSAGSGSPLSATVSALNTPISASTDAAGFYSLTLPAGAYTLRAASWNHRVMTAAVSLQANDLITRDFTLTEAPSVLLVDSGAWYYTSQIRYYQDALDALGYLYHTHSITNSLTGAPTITQMQSYSIAIWSSPFDSPDYVHAGNTLVQYLDRGGRLFLSGQDIAYWDGGGPGFMGYGYFPYRLHGIYKSDDVPSSIARGASGEALQGITFTVNFSDSARNQLTLDSVTPLDEDARALALYQNDEIAGLSVSTCKPYRVAYLAFGFEGVGSTNERLQAMSNIIDWLVALPPLRGASLSADDSIAIGTAGQTVTHSLTLRNTGRLSDTFTLSLSGNQWATSLWTGNFSQPLTSPLTLAPCASQTIGVRTDIPVGAPRKMTDLATFNVQSLGDASLSFTRTLTSKTPALTLLVDDDRWYEQRHKYEDALKTAGIAYDVYDTQGVAGPPLQRLQMYPLVVWFSAYDWFDPLSADDENRLAAYLNGGGRLFYTAQDYLDVRFGRSAFPRDYLGVLTYTNDVTITVVSGVTGSPISDGLGPYTLTFPYINFSDYLTPADNATAALIGNHTAPTALAARDTQANWKTVYFGFPFETLPTDDRPVVMSNVVGWLSPLGDSTVIAPGAVVTNSIFTYTLHLTTSLPSYTPTARVTVTLPASVTLLSLNDASLVYDAPTHSILWNGAVPPPTVPSWTVQVDSALVPGNAFAATATIHDTDEGIIFTRKIRTFIERQRQYLPLLIR